MAKVITIEFDAKFQLCKVKTELPKFSAIETNPSAFL